MPYVVRVVTNPVSFSCITCMHVNSCRFDARYCIVFETDDLLFIVILASRSGSGSTDTQQRSSSCLS